MSKEFKKGVTVGETESQESMLPMLPESTPQEVVEYDADEEETKALLRANEEDFIQGLIDAAEFGREETQRIEIIREGRLFFAFRIRPLNSEEYDKCRKKHTKYVRNRQLGMKLPEDTDKVRYQSALIYEATVPEDREILWDNRKVWNAINAKKDRIMNGLDVIECALKAGEKDKILEAIDKLSGYESDNLEEVVKN